MSEKKTKLYINVLIRDSTNKKVLLSHRKNGFGANKWNGIGGEIQPPESVIECGKRLTKEAGLEVNTLNYVGYIEFQVEDKMNEKIEMYILLAEEYSGELAYTEGSFHKIIEILMILRIL
jgi:hypothetical protein